MYGPTRGFLFLIALAALSMPAALSPDIAFSHGAGWAPSGSNSSPPATDSSSSRSSPPPSYSPVNSQASDRSFGSFSSGGSDNSSESRREGETESSPGPSRTPPSNHSDWLGGLGARAPQTFEVAKNGGTGEQPTNPADFTDGSTQLGPGTARSSLPPWLPRIALPPSTYSHSVIPASQLASDIPGWARMRPALLVATGGLIASSGMVRTLGTTLSLYQPSSPLDKSPEALTAQDASLPPVSLGGPANVVAYNARGGLIPGVAMYNFIPLIIETNSISIPIPNDTDPPSTSDQTTLSKTDTQKGGSTSTENHTSARQVARTASDPPADRNGRNELNNRRKHPGGPVTGLPVSSRPIWGHPISAPSHAPGRVSPTAAPAKPRTASFHRRRAFTPYSSFVVLFFARGQNQASATIVPPFGKRLVVGYYSLVNRLPSGQSVQLSYSAFVPASNERGLAPEAALDPGSSLAIYGTRSATDGKGSVLVWFYGYVSAVPRGDDLP